MLLRAALALAAAAALACVARADDAADSGMGVAIVPDAIRAVPDWASETDPCKLLTLSADECAARDPDLLIRALKAARRVAQRSGGGPEAAAAIEAAFKKLRGEDTSSEKAAQEREDL
jgi:hypothetical protein